MEFTDYLSNAMHLKPTGKAGEFMTTCPSCGKEDHLYIQTDKAVFYCFRCDYGRGKRIVDLIAELEGVDRREVFTLFKDLATKPPTESELEQSALATLLMQVFQADTPLPDIPLPEGCGPLPTSAWEYIYARGATVDHMAPYEAHFTNTFADPHIVFVERAEDGRVLWWQSRAATPNPIGPKTRNPKGADKPDVLFGSSGLRKDSYEPFIVEGIFDLLALSGDGMALLGKHISDAQAAYVSKHWSTVILALDADALDGRIRAMDTLRGFGVRVKDVIPVTDPGDAITDTVGITAMVYRKKARDAGLAYRVNLKMKKG